MMHTITGKYKPCRDVGRGEDVGCEVRVGRGKEDCIDRTMLRLHGSLSACKGEER